MAKTKRSSKTDRVQHRGEESNEQWASMSMARIGLVQTYPSGVCSTGFLHEQNPFYGGGPAQFRGALGYDVSFVHGEIAVSEHNPREQKRSLAASLEDLKEQLLRANTALQNVAVQKSNYAINSLMEVAMQNGIRLVAAWSKMDSWSNVTSLVIVPIEDYSDDKIEHLFEVANRMAAELSSPDFTWLYHIAYDSEHLDREKIYADGFTLKHEQITQPRTA